MIKKYWCRFHQKRIEKSKLIFIRWFNSLFPGKYCWADCVSYSFSPIRFNPFKLEKSTGCRIESMEHCNLSCYCGEWNNGKCFVTLTKEEQQKAVDDYKAHSLTTDDLPF